MSEGLSLWTVGNRKQLMNVWSSVCSVWRVRKQGPLRLVLLLSTTSWPAELIQTSRRGGGKKRKKKEKKNTEKELPGLVIILDEHQIVIRSSSPLLSIAPNTKGTWLDQNCFVWIALEAKMHAIIRSIKTLAKSHPCLWRTAKQGQKPKASHPRERNKQIRGSRLNRSA